MLKSAIAEHEISLHEQAFQAYSAVTGDARRDACDVNVALFLASQIVLTIPAVLDTAEIQALGAVHVAEDIRLHRLPEIGVSCRCSAAATHAEPIALGTIVTIEHAILDAADLPVAHVLTTLLLRGCRLETLIGARPARHPTTSMTGRLRAIEAEYVVDPETPERYAAASGDHNPVHLDAEVARSAGYAGPIVHGLCTLAQAATRVYSALNVRGPLRRVAGRFSNPVYPGDTVAIAGHQDEAGHCKFGARSSAGVCLKNALLEVRP